MKRYKVTWTETVTSTMLVRAREEREALESVRKAIRHSQDVKDLRVEEVPEQ